MSSQFDPNVHLAPYVEPEYRLSMKELGLDDAPANLSVYADPTAPTTQAPVGVTAPFKLCTLEGVKALRRDLFRKEVLDRYMITSDMTGPHCQLRGMAAATARVVYDFWTAPETLAMVSKAAGCEVVPVFDLELGHVNIQVPSGMTRKQYLATLKEDPFAAGAIQLPHSPPTSPAENAKTSSKRLEAPPQVGQEEPDMNNLVVGWHKDAYPIVVVLMLSDVSTMRGGETAIVRGDGSIIKAIGPEIGCAVVMQGGYIKHAALPCIGASERITMVTSFRPKHTSFRDVSNLKNILTCSDWNELYDQWVQSRIELVQDKLATYSRTLRERRRALESKASSDSTTRGARPDLIGPTVDLVEFARLIDDVDDHLRRALGELKPYDSEENPGFVWGRPAP
ncbi:unnamed protein product [Tilletia laevis]|uniref:Fe2OG dioxygenase domain-containing protein n=1 Tax=Tilletia laevis TaxID=157183 RepID=A0A9N8QLH2_9BASI|nr:unnamed protein product [Tilletia laevis]CAD6958587.1 unnamed protein product [Tilletia laevis]